MYIRFEKMQICKSMLADMLYSQQQSTWDYKAAEQDAKAAAASVV